MGCKGALREIAIFNLVFAIIAADSPWRFAVEPRGDPRGERAGKGKLL